MSKKMFLCTGVLLFLFCADEKKKSEEYLGKATEFLAMRNPDSAMVYVEKGIALNPEDARGYNIKGSIYFLLFEIKGDTNFALRSIKEYKNSLARDSLSWEAYINMGVALYKINKKKESLSYLKKGLELNPNYGARETVKKMIEDAESIKDTM